jgi:hypothetical protein
MREISVAEQRYQAVLAVISDGLSISQVDSGGGENSLVDDASGRSPTACKYPIS